jgi:hypothetical protein
VTQKIATYPQSLGPTLRKPCQARETFHVAPRRSTAVLDVLNLKREYLPHIAKPVPAYEFHLGSNRGFQIGEPARLPLHLHVDLFTPQDRHITYTVTASHPIPQPQLNAIAQSLTCPRNPQLP